MSDLWTLNIRDVCDHFPLSSSDLERSIGCFPCFYNMKKNKDFTEDLKLYLKCKKKMKTKRQNLFLSFAATAAGLRL